MAPAPSNALDVVFRAEWPRVVATLVRELRDLQLAEDMAQEAFVEAAARWDGGELPARPGAWLLTTARRRAIDVLRRERRFADRLPLLIEDAHPDQRTVADDQLALICGCCHPALDDEARVALTLRSVAGLSTREIAHAFMTSEATMAKRLLRAKRKIRAAGIPFTVPVAERLDERIDAIAAVVYAIFTEGHRRADGPELLRPTLCDEALFLAETLVDLVPNDAELRGLLALVLLTDARREARTDGGGRPVLLADQDRTVWDREKIRRGLGELAAAHRLRRPGPYQLLAAIASLHATSPSHEETAWDAMLGLYDALLSREPSPVVSLNRAVVLAEVEGPAAGLGAVDAVADDLADYQYLHSTRAELLHRCGDEVGSRAAMARAIELGRNEAEVAWMRARVAAWRRDASPAGG